MPYILDAANVRDQNYGLHKCVEKVPNIVNLLPFVDRPTTCNWMLNKIGTGLVEFIMEKVRCTGFG